MMENPKELPDSESKNKEGVVSISTNKKTYLDNIIESKKIDSNAKKITKTSKRNRSTILIRRLKIISLIITIIAGFGSVIYYIYSIMNGDTIILRPADTVIIQNSDILSNGNNDHENENIIIKKLIELQNAKGNTIPIEYFVGKIISINDSHWDTHGAIKKIQLDIQKTYDISTKTRINDVISCQIDPFNARFFKKWAEINSNTIEDPWKIKIKTDDLIWFRYTIINNINYCELFQINNINFLEFSNERIKLINSFTMSFNPISIVWSIEEFTFWEPVIKKSFSRADFFSERIIFTEYNSWAIFQDFYNEETYSRNPIILHTTTYYNGNRLIPLLNISCKLNYDNASALARFFRRTTMTPIEDKERISIEMYTKGNFVQGAIPAMWNYFSTERDPNSLMTFYFQDCWIRNINLFDMAHRNIVDHMMF